MPCGAGQACWESAGSSIDSSLYCVVLSESDKIAAISGCGTSQSAHASCPAMTLTATLLAGLGPHSRSQPSPPTTSRSRCTASLPSQPPSVLLPTPCFLPLLPPTPP